MQRSTRSDWTPPVRARPGPGARPAVETPQEQELRKRLGDVQRNLRGQISANHQQQHRLRDLQLLLKQKDSENQVLQGLNQQLLDDKTAIMEYGQQLWREREQEMADAVASGLVQLKEYVDNLEEQNDGLCSLNLKYKQQLQEKDDTIQALQQQMKLLVQRSQDDHTVQELESAYSTIQELEDNLKEKNYQLEMFHLELHKVSDDKECLQQQVQKLQAEQASAQLQKAPKETESIQKLQQQQQRLQELEETLEKKDCALEMLEAELNKASDDRDTIQDLRRQVEMLEAECSSYKERVNEEVQMLRTTIQEQKDCLEKQHKAIEQFKEVKLSLQGQLQEAEEKYTKTLELLRGQVDKLQAEKIMATQLQAKQAEKSHDLVEKQKRLEETLRNKDHTLEMFHLKLTQSSEDRQSIERLREEMEKVKAEHQSYEQALHTQRSSLESALIEQKQRATEAEIKAEELERSLQTEHTNIHVLRREMESQKGTFDETLKGFYASYGSLMEDKKLQEEKVKELRTMLHSSEEQRTSVLHRCEELESRAEELQLALEQTKQKKKKRWFKLWH